MAPPISDIYHPKSVYDGDTTWQSPRPQTVLHSHCDSVPCPSHRHRAHGICGHTHRSPRQGITHIKPVDSLRPYLRRPMRGYGSGGSGRERRRTRDRRATATFLSCPHARCVACVVCRVSHAARPRDHSIPDELPDPTDRCDACSDRPLPFTLPHALPVERVLSRVLTFSRDR